MTEAQADISMVRVCLRFVAMALRRWRALTAVVATMLIGIGLAALTPWPFKVLVDNVLYGQPLGGTLKAFFEALPGPATTEALLVWSVGAGLVLFLLGWALGIAASFANLAFGERLVYDLGSRLFDHLQRLSLRFHNRHGAGNLIRRVTVDTGSISTIVNDAILPIVGSVVSLVTMFTIMWQLDPTLTLLSVSVIPVLALALRLYSRPMLERSYAQEEQEGKLYDTLEQNLSTIQVVQAFGGEERADRQLKADTEGIVSKAIASLNVQLRFKILAGLATAAGTAAILWLGAQRALDGGLTVGTILVFLSYLGALYGPLESLAYTGSTVQEAGGSARRVIEVLDEEPEVFDRPGAQPLPPVSGHVSLENVTFGYEPVSSGFYGPVLHDVTLEARPGERLAIVGATGAGKSTLVSLIPRFLDPDEGRVLIDGHDVRDVQLKSLRSQISLVLQESFLFPISIADNIAYGRPESSRKKIEAAARAANAHSFIEELPQGYETVVGERGATLSGGERQRVAIARALLQDAPILILDEPTSALDAETESVLLEALDRLMAGRTTLIIAHRLSTIRDANRIVVLADGKIVEEGPHQELLERGEAYARLHALQMGAPNGDVHASVTLTEPADVGESAW